MIWGSTTNEDDSPGTGPRTSETKRLNENIHLSWQGHGLVLNALIPNYLSSHINIVASKSGRLTIACWARIDNSLELSSKLGLSSPNLKSHSSADLILAAYQYFGEDCVKHIIGDWLFLIWDASKKELFVARDPLGHAPFYYYSDHSGFYFSTDLNKLLGHSRVPKDLNSNAFLQMRRELSQDSQTFYRDVYLLQCAHYLVISPSAIRNENYWAPSNLSPIIYSQKEDYLQHFSELLQTVVTCRLGNTNQGLALSSGLDSSAIAALIDSEYEGTDHRLNAFTWRPSELADDLKVAPNRYLDELPLVETFVNTTDNIDLTIVEGKHNNLIESIRLSLDIHGQPYLDNVHYFEILEAARQKGVKNLMTGYGGNYTVSYDGNPKTFFVELLRKHQWGQLFRDSVYWKLKNKVPLHLLGKQVLNLLEPGKFFNRKCSFQEERIVFDALNQNAVTENFKIYENSYEELNSKRIRGSSPLITDLLRLLYTAEMDKSSEIHRAFGMETTSPFLDKRMIDYCLNIPIEQFLHKGEKRIIIKRAMTGKLPKSIIGNTKRGFQGGDFLSKIRNEKDDIYLLIQRFKKSPGARYWLDINLIEKALQELIHPLNRRTQKKLIMNRMIMLSGMTLGIFLLRHEGTISN